MFQNRRFIVAIFIIIAGAGISFWIINSKSHGSITASLFEIVKSGTDSGRFAAINDNIQQAAIDSIKESQYDDSNITDRVIARYQREIFSANKYGAGTSSSVAIPNESVLESIIAEELSKGLSIKNFETKDIKISSENSKEAMLSYLDRVQKTYLKNLGGQKNQYLEAVADIAINQGSDKLRSYLASASDQITDLLAIASPSNLASFHLDLINSWNKRYELGKMILEGEQDSLKSIAAIEELSNSTDEEENLLTSLENAVNTFLP